MYVAQCRNERLLFNGNTTLRPLPLRLSAVHPSKGGRNFIRTRYLPRTNVSLTHHLARHNEDLCFSLYSPFPRIRLAIPPSVRPYHPISHSCRLTQHHSADPPAPAPKNTHLYICDDAGFKGLCSNEQVDLGKCSTIPHTPLPITCLITPYSYLHFSVLSINGEHR